MLERLTVSYETFRLLFTKLPVYYQGNETGFCELYAIGENEFIKCSLGQTEQEHFTANFLSSCVEVSSQDDAFVRGKIAKNIPFCKNYQIDRATAVAVVGREGKETIWSTHNYCDRTTWFGDSVRASEVLSDSGDGLTFSGSHPYWIDMVHGKVFDEDSLRTDVAHGYDISVVVADVTQSMRAPFAASGGDYTVNYASGTITFASPVYTPVTGSYSYENGSAWYLRPYEGKAIDLEQAEAQFSVDCDMNDTIHFTVYGFVDVFAPQYLIENGGPYPSGTKIPLEETVYKTIYTLIDEALGSYPVIPALGSSTNPRMNPVDVYGFPFTYNAVRRLSSLYGLELRVYLENHVVYGGNRATATFYCVTRELTDT